MAENPWQDLGSAPQDGRFVSLRVQFSDGPAVVPAARYVKGRGWMTYGGGALPDPTAWRHAPAMFND